MQYGTTSEGGKAEKGFNKLHMQYGTFINSPLSQSLLNKLHMQYGTFSVKKNKV